jgi:hypothetical protein
MNDTDKFTEEVTKAFGTEYRKVVDTQLARVTRPWRILAAWLLAWDMALTVLFVVLFVMWVNR